MTNNAQDKTGVHQIHCCTDHGCSYGELSECPVFRKDVPQIYPCEFCSLNIDELTDATEHMPDVLVMHMHNMSHEIYRVYTDAGIANIRINRTTGAVTTSHNIEISLSVYSWINARAQLCALKARFNHV